MARLSIQRLCKQYGDTMAVKDVSMEAQDGEFLVLLGPSGCGKTTTLRMVAGFVLPSAGAIHVGDRDITTLPPWKRHCGLVFQNYALFPHMTVTENVAFGLQMHKVDRAEQVKRTREALDLVRLQGMGDRYPRQLSGGQQQRVAIARALAIQPEILLLDEPLSNLDAKLRQEVRVEIRELQQRLGVTTVMVTHDQEEALTMADRMVVMRHGEVLQIGTQKDLYEKPADRFVAGFIGKASFLEGQFISPGRFRTDGGLEINHAGPANRGKGAIALRSEHLVLGEGAAHMENHFIGTIEHAAYMGAVYEIGLRLNAHDRLTIQMPNQHDVPAPVIGGQLPIGWPAALGMTYVD